MAGNGAVDRNLLSAGALLVALVLLVAAANPLTIVGPGTRGVLLNFGKVQDKILDEGLHLRIPVVQEIIPFSVRVQKTDILARWAPKICRK
ncbi:MAG: SPFH domain-containing protein [Pseudanabaenaceae cyanobacterium]